MDKHATKRAPEKVAGNFSGKLLRNFLSWTLLKFDRRALKLKSDLGTFPTSFFRPPVFIRNTHFGFYSVRAEIMSASI